MSEGRTEEELVERLRDLATVVHERSVGPDRQTAALGHLDAALALLGAGTPRRRWYEAEVDAAVEGGADEANRGRTRDVDLSPFTGPLNVVAPPMRIRSGTLADGRPALVGSVRLGRLREGPPRSAHGGVVAGLFDDLLGGGSRLGGGPPGMTGRLVVRYRRPTPLDVDLELRAWIHDERSRRVVVRGECVVPGAGDGGVDVVTAQAEAVFLRVDFVGLEAQMADRAADEVPRPAPRRRG